MNDSATAIPSHVPPDLVRDVDPYDLEGGAQDAHLAWKRVQDAAPDVYYTPRYGGYWVLNRASLLNEVWHDHERFCSSGGISVPPLPPGLPPQLPIVADPPLHRHYRHPLSMALSPKRVHDLHSEMRALAIELIEGFRDRGECEFVQDFSMHLPMIVFLRLVDLPLTDRAWLIARAEIATRSPDLARRGLAFQEIFGYLDSCVRQRALEPGDDLISDITRIMVGDRPITHEEALGECSLALFGGLDTVAGSMGFFMRFLAEHPAHRQQLIDDPTLIPAAVEELLRRHSIPLVARTVTQDLTLGGVAMKAGDHLILETALHGLDERAWPNALRVDFRRDVRDHMAFGRGVHKCPGANLARAELRILLEEWLQRIPHFSTRTEDPPVTANGAVMGVLRLPLVWPASTSG
jgi:cytochrome P450